jgi:hypothetical protein
MSAFWSWTTARRLGLVSAGGSVVRQETRRMLNDRLPRLPDRSSGPRQRSPLGHEDAFPPPRLSGRCRFSQGTFAGTRGNGEDAPKNEPARAGGGAQLTVGAFYQGDAR